MTLDERETTIQWSEADKVAHIYTCQKRMMALLDKHPETVRTETHRDGRGTITGVEYKIPVAYIRIRPKRSVSPAQRAHLARMTEERSQKDQSDLENVTSRLLGNGGDETEPHPPTPGGKDTVRENPFASGETQSPRTKKPVAVGGCA